MLIGHAGHPEVEGTMGQWNAANTGEILLVESSECVAALEPKFPHELSYVTQTTLSVDDTKAIIAALREKFPAISKGRARTTSATPPRIARMPCADWPMRCDLVLVVGSVNSSNSNRLRELAEKQGVRSYLIDGAEHIRAQLARRRHAHWPHRRRLRT